MIENQTGGEKRAFACTGPRLESSISAATGKWNRKMFVATSLSSLPTDARSPGFAFLFSSDPKPGASPGGVTGTQAAPSPEPQAGCSAVGPGRTRGTRPHASHPLPGVTVLGEVRTTAPSVPLAVQGAPRKGAVTGQGGGRCPGTGPSP